ncbi:hypothetical protein [Brevibacterium album]|uniref:hypothetical protein n=1 Tax=Brevibacterium album TaxID=417948 RepID=UPI0004187E17|nr:hypothetical protein [Brevibacterium album]
MSLSAPERETVVSVSDADERVRIWTAQRRHINKLRKSPKAVEVASGQHDGSEWAAFEVDADQWSPASGIRRTRNLTDEQRAAARERLARAREKTNKGD